MLTFRNLNFRYNRRRDALCDVSATVRPGLCLLMGENGAGKTTLLNICDGGLLPNSGSIDFDGADPSGRDPRVLRNIFFLPDNYISPFRTIRQAARYHAPMYPDFNPVMLDDNLSAFGLSGDEKLRSLSLGMLHKTNIAFALSLHPRLLLLDEPANGLDISSKKELRRMVSRCIDPEQTVIISTHTVADLEMLYDSVLLLHRGRTLLSASLDRLTERLGFIKCSVTPQNALYAEPDGILFRAIIPTDDKTQTIVDYELLYSALMSDESTKDAIVNLLND